MPLPSPAALYLPDRLGSALRAAAPAPRLAAEQPLKAAAGGRSGSQGTRPPQPPHTQGERGRLCPTPGRPVHRPLEPGVQMPRVGTYRLPTPVRPGPQDRETVLAEDSLLSSTFLSSPGSCLSCKATMSSTPPQGWDSSHEAALLLPSSVHCVPSPPTIFPPPPGQVLSQTLVLSLERWM